MKLLLCPKCYDVIKLQDELRTCKCGYVKGRYTDNLNAEISEGSVPIALLNSALAKAVRNQPSKGHGYRFEAFVIPKKCETVTVKKLK